MFSLIKRLTTITFSVVLIALQWTSAIKAQPTLQIVSIAWSPDGNKLAAVGQNGLFRVWDTAKNQVVMDARNFTGTIQSVTWKPDSSRIAIASSIDGTIRVWNAITGQPIAVLQSETDPQGRAIIAWSPDGKKIASVLLTESAPVKVWSTEQDQYHVVSTSSNATFYALAWNPDSTKLVVGGIVGTYIFDDVDKAHLTSRLIGPFATSLAWSPDGKKLALSAVDGQVHILAADTGQELATFRGKQGATEALVWSPDGNRLAASMGNTIQVWNANTGAALESYTRVKSTDVAGTSLGWSPQGGRLAYLGSIASNAANRTQTIIAGAMQIVVPSPDVNELQAITKRCVTQPSMQQGLLSRVSTLDLNEFVSQIKQIPQAQMPAACAADLVAVAEALQKP
jgi:WD40 repeat protein